jgi:arsenate reductase
MTDPADDRHRLAFVCVRNAGRSQMATAFAEREVCERGLAGRVELVTGGTDPADAVHDVVVAVLAEVGLDAADRAPRAVDPDELAACDVVATMGCSTLELPAAVDARDWNFDDPGEADVETARRIRDEVETRVVALFDELYPATAGREVADGG